MSKSDCRFDRVRDLSSKHFRFEDSAPEPIQRSVFATPFAHAKAKNLINGVFVLWTLNNDLVVSTNHAPGKGFCSTRSVLMLDKHITYAYAAIEIAIGRDKLLAQFKISAQLPMPQPSDDGVDRASVLGSVDAKFDSDSRQTNDLKIGIHNFPA